MHGKDKACLRFGLFSLKRSLGNNFTSEADIAVIFNFVDARKAPL